MNTIEIEKKKHILGNKGLSSNEESAAAEYLREHFLDRTNEMSAKVQPRSTMYTKVGKRILDILIAFPACVILLPFNIIFGKLVGSTCFVPFSI